MAAFTKYSTLSEKLANADIDFGSDTLKVMLLDDSYSFDAEDSTVADLTGEVSGNNYTSGGETLSNVAVSRSGAVTTIDSDDLTFADDDAGFAGARFAVVVTDSGELVGAVDLGSDKTNVATTLTLQLSASGLITIQ